jgi:hypothetical protein
MRLKETIRLVKEALQNPHLYSEAEIAYMKKSLDMALIERARKQYKNKQKGFGNYEDPNSQTN